MLPANRWGVELSFVTLSETDLQRLVEVYFPMRMTGKSFGKTVMKSVLREVDKIIEERRDRNAGRK